MFIIYENKFYKTIIRQCKVIYEKIDYENIIKNLKNAH